MEDQHGVLEEGVVDLSKVRVAETGEVDAADFGAELRAEGANVNHAAVPPS
jgi:hypothetical protein